MMIKEFVEAYKSQRFIMTKNGANEKSEYLKRELEIKTYIPFKKKREIAEMVVEKNIEVIDGIKKYDSISGYIGLIVASIMAHTNLKFSSDPVADYDLLAESGLLSQVIAEFQGSHDEIDILVKMALAMELEDNSVSALIGHFLDKIIKMLDGVSGALKDKFADFGLDDINEEDLARLTGLLDKLK